MLQILGGISVDVKLNVWKKIADVLIKLVEAGEIDESLAPLLGGLSPAFLLKLSLNLDIGVDEYMQNKIQ